MSRRASSASGKDRGNPAADQALRPRKVKPEVRGRTAAAKSARQTARGAARKRQDKEKPAQYSLGREILRTSLGCFWVLLGLVLCALCVGFWWGSRVLVSVLDEIGERNFGEQMERVDHYYAFFEQLNHSGYEVHHDKNIIQGVTNYLWTVQPRGTHEVKRFQWNHDLEHNQVDPQTNPALLADIKLGYIELVDANLYNFYNPEDRIAQSIVEDQFSLLQPADLAPQGTDGRPQESPVMAPLISPGEARQRAAEDEEEEEEAGEEGDGEEGEEGSSAERQQSRAVEVADTE